MNIRTVTPADAPALLQIYKPYVEKTAVTFEYSVPSVSEFRERIEHTLKRYPYITAAEDGELIGYAYTGPFVARAAYDWSAETAIYVREDQKGRGIGKKLYRALEEISRAQHITNLYACIGYPDTEDDYLTKDSVNFHEHMGYHFAGRFENCGYKFGYWYHMVWMEKVLSEHTRNPKKLIPFPEIV